MARRRSPLGQARSDSYRLARFLGDLSAASRGPVPLAKRMVRRKVYRRTNRGLWRVLRRAGLG